MTGFERRRRLLRTVLLSPAYGPLFASIAAHGKPPRDTAATRTRQPAAPIPPAQINDAIAQLDRLVNAQMARTGVPGLAVAVVRGARTVYAKGFGTRQAGTRQPVDADTVFQLASLSKPVGASVVARQVGLGSVSWDTKVRDHLPWFSLADPEVSKEVTIADLYAHRSGLPDHAGDRLEDLGFDRDEILRRLRYLPLHPFRQSYFYTNFGLTAAAESVAAAAHTDWASLSEQAIYQPLKMTRTSSRYADFAARENRAVGHVKTGDHWVIGPARMPDAQSPAGGVSSSVNDMARWLAMMLGNGMLDGQRIVEEAPLNAAISKQVQSSPPGNGRPAGFYGYGFNVGITAAGRDTYSHSGAFALGAATNFVAVPSTGLAIIVLTNGYPIGVPETITAQFFDLVQFGSIQRDWASLYAGALAGLLKPEGSLVGAQRPAAPFPARALSAYTGTYRNDYYGPLQVSEQNGALLLGIGPVPIIVPVTHWDGDVFTFTLYNENAAPGTISKASFLSDRVTLEYYDEDGSGTFVR
ncbi:serine hydrolase [Paraburkholderia rhizosphaerae]|uniref:CubicO group peptidase (Beta-lactamase class C family) n=1 Tax=Paraburkholderia rhizosphaerae TaxID=480658 RepID=A0A4R8LLF9_9BURK|nr:serine hydrolase [Paraburkholderia rhizosphaerae]TDY45372.1 CubicO group peptidase (beta-lactamase class C family) [Paraburkholderia rhizosphaerae]